MTILMAKRQRLAKLALSVLVSVALLAVTGAAQSADIPDDTVMVSTGNGRVTEYTEDGTFIAQINTTTGSFETTGSAFDANGNFFVTDFTANNVTKFDPTGALIGQFGSGYNAHPESIVFDGIGNVYIGQADGARRILEFSSSGAPIASFAPATELRGTDWIVLAGDGCTMFYTSEGHFVKRFNVCTNTQLPNFNPVPLPGPNAYAFKLLPAGGLIVADTSAVIRLDASGNQVQTYTLPGVSLLFAVNLDPDNVDFWTADIFSGKVFEVNIATGAIVKQWSAAGAPNFVDVAGLSLKGEIQPIISKRFTVTHFDVNGGDGTVRLVNPTTTSAGRVCAMVYVFDAHEELQECCGCPVTNNGLRVMSTIRDLTANPLTGAGTNLKTGVIKIVTGAPNSSSGLYVPCNPATGYNVDPSMQAWSTHKYLAKGGGTNVTEAEFLDSPLDAAELSALTSTCAFIHTNGTGRGICTCGVGDNSAPVPGGGVR